ncbi:SapC family protein [Algibacillus agarilyticus]|uniref:SapC family protein n=1 Tax=Algibacillus agarilyticus TaxID=2234133 RepID=UPI000DCFAC6B|nr:SapC family protein [Algibacillus agarilyticus]
MKIETVEIVDINKHRNLKVDVTNYDVAHNRINAAYVTVIELSTLVNEYPVFITKNPRDGQFQLSAIMGFKSGENLFLQNGKWNARFIPTDILRRPFQAALAGEGENTTSRIALDIASELVQTEKGEALFEDDGKPSAYLNRINQNFAQLYAGTQQSKAILQKANELNLIEPVSIDFELKGQSTPGLNGLYSINRKTLGELSGQDLEECHQSGCLQVCYALLSSVIHLDKLVNWVNEQ